MRSVMIKEQNNFDNTIVHLMKMHWAHYRKSNKKKGITHLTNNNIGKPLIASVKLNNDNMVRFVL